MIIFVEYQKKFTSLKGKHVQWTKGCILKTTNEREVLNSIVCDKFIDSSDSHLFSMILLCIALLNFWLRTVFVFSLNFLCFHNFYFFFNYCNNKNITKTRQEVIHLHLLFLSWWRYLSYRNQSIALQINGLVSIC